MDLTSDELIEIAVCLNMRKNYIETGTAHLSANDAVDNGQSKLVRRLDKDQKEKVK